MVVCGMCSNKKKIKNGLPSSSIICGNKLLNLNVAIAVGEYE